ncbi:hypothetical protein NQ317_012215 [Molorchus minor]|uniref:Uncharacterized protein n=1 Tax=Molorchus minor TaxID=1323400 RepID=A0ABQ9IRT3_9CUCU|nr:hypothetical protein NQ317_012215 [Molorchus minor]
MSTTDFTKPEYRFNSNTFGIKSNDDIVPILRIAACFPECTTTTWSTTSAELRCTARCSTAQKSCATETAIRLRSSPGEIKIIHDVCAVGIKYVSYIGSGLPGLIKTFWPDNQPSIWDRISDKVEALLNSRGRSEEGKPREYLRANYVNIAQHVIDFENVFVFDKQVPDYRTVNQYILPYYSLTVLMKVSFYVIGVRYRQRIGLTNGDIEKILYCARSTIYGCKANLGANKYIENMYLEEGLEYICIWNHLVENLTYKGIYNDVVTYSTFFGRQTPKQIAWAIPEEPNEPLSPSLVNGRRNEISRVDFFIWHINNGKGPARIGGFKVSFKIGSSYILGTVCKDVVTVEFNDALLIKMEVFGTGAVDRLRLHFSDGRDINVGENGSNHNAVFELENHHIVGMFVASDNWSLSGQAANFSVAYKLIDRF